MESKTPHYSPELICKRHATNEMVTLEVYGRTTTITCKMNNLSLTGSFLELTNSNYVPKKGELVKMTVVLRQLNKSHIVYGEVIWSRGVGLGVAFLKSSDLHKRPIKLT